MKPNRLDTMARFEEPSDEPIIRRCSCGYEIYEGETMEYIDDELVCHDCADDYYSALRKANTKRIRLEDEQRED